MIFLYWSSSRGIPIDMEVFPVADLKRLQIAPAGGKLVIAPSCLHCQTLHCRTFCDIPYRTMMGHRRLGQRAHRLVSSHRGRS